MVILGVVCHVTDVWQFRRWAYPFVVVGRNALFAFVVVPLLPLREFTMRFVGGDIGELFGQARLLMFTAVDLLIAWLLLYWMYLRNLFVKI